MAEETKKWYEHDRVQGFGIMLIGVALLFAPIPKEAGLAVIMYGSGWGSAGAKNALKRK